MSQNAPGKAFCRGISLIEPMDIFPTCGLKPTLPRLRRPALPETPPRPSWSGRAKCWPICYAAPPRALA